MASLLGPPSKSHFENMEKKMAKSFLAIVGVLLVSWTILATAADDKPIVQVDWTSRTASCPAKVTQSTAVIVRVTGVNDLVIDFQTGDRFLYQFRAKGTPVSVVPPENPFITAQAGFVPEPCSISSDNELQAQIEAIKRINDARITPPSTGARTVDLQTTINAALSHKEIQVVNDEFHNDSCKPFFDHLGSDMVIQWIKRLNAAESDPSAPPLHSVDFPANLEPNQNYDFNLQELWHDKKTQGGALAWKCGETDIISLSVGPLITTLPYRTYSHQKAPVPPGSSTTQDILVVSGTTNVNTLGAALLNVHIPQIPSLPSWTGFALSVGPVYTLGNAPSVSHLGLFVGGSVHLYRSFYITPGLHIGEFADFPAGFAPGSVIPNQFGDLNPVKRNTAHFAIGITYKTNSFKKSSQNTGAAKSDAGGSGTTPNQKTTGNPQPVPGNRGSSGNGGQPAPGTSPPGGSGQPNPTTKPPSFL